MENLDLLVLRDLLDWRRAGERRLLATVIRTGGPSPRPAGSILASSETDRLVRRRVSLVDGLATHAPAPQPEELRVDDACVLNTFGPSYRMSLIGAGQPTGDLATMARFKGFEATVCDPRDEARATWRVPGARVIADMPDGPACLRGLQQQAAVRAERLIDSFVADEWMEHRGSTASMPSSP